MATEIHIVADDGAIVATVEVNGEQVFETERLDVRGLMSQLPAILMFLSLAKRKHVKGAKP